MVWSLTEPCTNTRGGPSPSTQTAIDPPSPDFDVPALGHATHPRLLRPLIARGVGPWHPFRSVTHIGLTALGSQR
jgi:hypothetical protein